VVALAAGLVLHGAMGLVVLVSGLIMPIWAVLALGAVWIIGFVVVIRWRAKPSVVLLVPVVMFAIWAFTAWLGDRFLDWTA